MIKLAKLPDRTPVKLSITVSPELNAALLAYAQIYRETYGPDEPVTELIPAMLSSFLDGDRAFARGRAKAVQTATGATATVKEES